MDISYLKEYILDNHLVPNILESLGCHHIKYTGSYYTAGNVDGDNPNAITVYLNDSITTVDYTRKLIDSDRACDIFDLVKFFENCNFFQAIKKICDWIGLDYYTDTTEELPESLKLTALIYDLTKDNDAIDEDKPVKPISERILTYYDAYVNDMFAKDGISYDTQADFEIGYDELTNRITIPIRDEIGTLVGVKGRLFKSKLSEDEMKYLYIEPVNRSRILYGLNKTMPYIQRKRKVYLVESEKGVLQLWDMGIRNAVATGGKKISSAQIKKLTRLEADIVILFDKDVTKEELQSIADRFIDTVKVSAVIDHENILGDKESPTDDKYKFQRLIQNDIEQLR